MVSPALVQGQQITVKSMLNGQTMYNVIKYSSTIIGAYTDTEIFCTNFVDNILPYWEAILSQEAQIIQVRADAFAPAGVPAFPPYVVPLGVAGDVADQALPPHVSARLYKSVDPEESYPTLPPTPWRFGMIRIGGIPESAQDAGILNSAYMTNLLALTNALINVNAASFDWQMHIDRIVAGTPYWGVIGSLNAGNRLGSQNTRKL